MNNIDQLKAKLLQQAMCQVVLAHPLQNPNNGIAWSYFTMIV